MLTPKYDKLFNPVLIAIKNLGGSASIRELDEEVIRNLHLSDEDLAEMHDQSQTELEYQLAWTRTYLKNAGLLDNSARGIWIVTEKGRETEAVDSLQIKKVMRDRRKVSKRNSVKEYVITNGKEDVSEISVAQPIAHPNLNIQLPLVSVTSVSEIVKAVEEQTWREKLAETLLTLKPDAFERLCQRLLRESGFVQVKVTGRSGDGGIDGVGVVRIGGLLGFPVLFQCKRYKGSVGAGVIRDFRGAMIGRADRGLVITTGTFTRDARAEATRDGAPPIDLVDGEDLLDKLKELQLGVAVKMIPEVTVDPDFFKSI